jgi:hypothetical protein
VGAPRGGRRRPGRRGSRPALEVDLPLGAAPSFPRRIPSFNARNPTPVRTATARRAGGRREPACAPWSPPREGVIGGFAYGSQTPDVLSSAPARAGSPHGSSAVPAPGRSRQPAARENSEKPPVTGTVPNPHTSRRLCSLCDHWPGGAIWTLVLAGTRHPYLTLLSPFRSSVLRTTAPQGWGVITHLGDVPQHRVSQTDNEEIDAVTKIVPNAVLRSHGAGLPPQNRDMLIRGTFMYVPCGQVRCLRGAAPDSPGLDRPVGECGPGQGVETRLRSRTRSGLP